MYRVIKELWAFDEERIAVRFAYECHDGDGKWFRSYGNDNWEFGLSGLKRRRIASINDLLSTNSSESITGTWAGARMIIPRSPISASEETQMLLASCTNSPGVVGRAGSVAVSFGHAFISESRGPATETVS